MAMSARITNTVHGMVAEKRNGVRTFHRHDPLGSTIGLVNEAGTTTDTYTYWPYGTLQSSTGSTQQPWKLGGQWGYYTDSATHSYVRARKLRKDLGRWLTVDPLWPLRPSYSYGSSSPVTSIDPLGLKPVRSPLCTKENNDWIVEFCRDCYRRNDFECIRVCSALAADYYRCMGKQPPRPSGDPGIWTIKPGVGVVPPPFPGAIKFLPPRPEIAPSPPQPPRYTVEPGGMYPCVQWNQGCLAESTHSGHFDLHHCEHCCYTSFVPDSTGYWSCIDYCRISQSVFLVKERGADLIHIKGS